MRWYLCAASLFLLTACGGGGGGGVSTPVPVATNAPPAYTSYLRFIGPMAGRTTLQAVIREARSLAPKDAATPVPIMVVTSDTANGNSPGSGPAFGGQIEAVVSPMPSATNIPVTFSNTNSAATIAATPTPLPGQTPMPLPTGVIAVNNVNATAGATNIQTAGTATATIGSPVNQSPQVLVFSYKSISVDCDQTDIGSAAGWKYDASSASWVTVTDPAQADIYLIGPKCPGAFSAPTTSGYAQLNIPGGGLTQSTDNVFASIVASQCTNTETSVDMGFINTINPDGSQNTEVCAKTRDGLHVFKLFPNSFGPYPGSIAGAVEIAGSGIDGF